MAITSMRKFKQTVMSAPGKILVEKYLTAKGKYLLLGAKTKAEKAEIWTHCLQYFGLTILTIWFFIPICRMHFRWIMRLKCCHIVLVKRLR